MKDELIAKILQITDAYGFSETTMPGYLYAKVLYLMDDLSSCLSTTEREQIELYGVQHGVEMISGRPDFRNIPEMCYAIRNGEAIIIQKNNPMHIDLGFELELGEAQKYVDEENRKLGVTAAQVNAMIDGLNNGWDSRPATTPYYQASTLDSDSREQMVL